MSDQGTTVINNVPTHSPDHDLLLTLKAEVTTKLDRVISDVRDLRDDTVARIGALEQEKLGTTAFNTYKEQVSKDFEEYKDQAEAIHASQQTQIDFANNWVRYGIGGLALFNALLGFYQLYKSLHP